MVVRVVSSEFGAILADLRTIIRIYFLVEPHLRSLNGLMPPLLLSFLLDCLCMFDSLHSLLSSAAALSPSSSSTSKDAKWYSSPSSALNS